jgi:hypothetical protein
LEEDAMENEILIRFSKDQWWRLEPHIEGIVSDVGGIFDCFTNQPDHMIMCNEEIYERLMTVGRNIVRTSFRTWRKKSRDLSKRLRSAKSNCIDFAAAQRNAGL